MDEQPKPTPPTPIGRRPAEANGESPVDKIARETQVADADLRVKTIDESELGELQQYNVQMDVGVAQLGGIDYQRRELETQATTIHDQINQINREKSKLLNRLMLKYHLQPGTNIDGKTGAIIYATPPPVVTPTG